LDKLLAEHRAAINAVIRVEVLTGSRDETQYAALDEQLRGIHVLPLTESVWRLTGRLRFQLKRSGHTMTVADVVIASCAMIHNAELLHRDEHFNIIARHNPLKLYKA
jgi:predicted nucleic acid-binding protein